MSKKAGKLTALLLAGMMLAAPLAEVAVYADEPETIPEEKELTGEILTEDGTEEVLTEDASDDGLLLDKLDGQAPDGEEAEEVDADEVYPSLDGTPWDALAKEFYPYYEMGVTGALADDKVTTAYLRDVETSEDDKTGLVEDGSYKVLSVTPETEDGMPNGYVDVEITAKELRSHKNGENMEGHWIGVAIPVVSLDGYDITYSPTLTLKDFLTLEGRSFSHEITDRYTDDEGNVTHITSYIGYEQLINEEQDYYYIYARFHPTAGGANIYTAYKIIFKDITLKEQKVEDITVSPKSATVGVGGAIQLDTEVTPSYAADKSLEFTSDHPEIADFDEEGWVTGISPGRASIKIKAKDGSGEEATAIITVKAKKKKDQTIMVSDEFRKTVGDEPFDLEAETNGDGKLSYVSDNTDIVTVSRNGLVKIKKAGTATITITAAETYEYNEAEKTVKVIVSEKQKIDQTIIAEDQTATVGDEPFALEVETIGDGELSFSSSDTKVVTIGAKTGLVKVVGAGTAIITITAAETEEYNKATKTIKIIVSPEEKEDTPEKTDISGATVTGIKTRVYTGNKLKQDPTVKLNGKKLVRGTDYRIVYQGNRIDAGKATFLVKGMGSYTGSIKKTFRIKKAKNGLSVSTKRKDIAAGTIAEKSRTVKADSIFKVRKNNGKVTYKKKKGSQKITVNKNGDVTIKPGVKKGAHKVTVKVTAAGDKNHEKISKSVVFTLVIK